MRDDVREAVLACVAYADEHGVRSSLHIAPITKIIRGDMVGAGYDEGSIYTDRRHITLPGWFRISKQWDITAFDGDTLVGAIELKTINKDFSKNFNNRAEESLGNAQDTIYATNNHLLEPCIEPLNFGYAIIVRKNAESAEPSQPQKRSIYEFDKVFDHTSPIDRFVILGRRLLREKVYQAVWVVTADLENGVVEEPDPLLSYNRFITTVKTWVDIARA